MKEKRIFFWVSFLAILLVTVPYVLAFREGNQGWVFSGFLLNPIDGHSYLAKMQQGFQGNWKFILPYTAEAGEGAYLFLFYISLGHLSRILNIPLILVFHLFRLLGSVVLLYSIRNLALNLFQESRYQLLFFSLAVFGSGLGWLGVLIGQFTSDFWVAEAYPFLSMYSNPHFPLGLGIMIQMLIPGKQGVGKTIISGLMLAIIQPFTVVLVLVILAVTWIRDLIDLHARNIKQIWRIPATQKLLGAGLGGGSFLLFQYYSILNDPVLSVWNAQNLTPPPTLMDFLISFSPVLFLAAIGVKTSLRSDAGRMILAWALTALVLLLIPSNLQRRFLSGIYIPLAVMAIYGLKELIDKYQFKFRTLATLLLILVVPTNLIGILSGIQATGKHNESIFYTAELALGLDWISNNTSPDDIFLADKDIGLLIPSVTGRKVIYGHPFETANAKAELDYINAFFTLNLGDQIGKDYLEQRKIDFVLVQKGLGFSNADLLISNGYEITFENMKTVIFQNGSR